MISTPTDLADATVNGALSHPEHHDVVVIGGGQAGLATGYYLARNGVDFVILDAHERVGDAWRNRWDSLALFTPARVSGLPGQKFPGAPYRFPTKDEVAAYLESYAEAMRLPVRNGVEATGVARSAQGGWTIETTGQPLLAGSVVIATGGYPMPKVPAWASDLGQEIVQLHSSEYRTPGQLQSGSALVVGASHSGAEIAIELSRDRHTILAGRDTGEVPFPTTGRMVPFILPVVWFVMNRLLTVKTPMGRKAKTSFRNHGFPLEHPGRRDIVAAGVERITERVTGASDGKPMLAGGRVLDVANVVWCTGFTGDYAWVEGVMYGDDGYPMQERGVAAGAPGLYFVGLKFQTMAVSSLIGGVGRDAKAVADHIAARVLQAT